MHNKSLDYYDDYYDFLDYKEASKILSIIAIENLAGARTLLDVACGTGRHLEFLQHDFLVEGLDINPVLLARLAQRCPGVPIHQVAERWIIKALKTTAKAAGLNTCFLFMARMYFEAMAAKETNTRNPRFPDNPDGATISASTRAVIYMESALVGALNTAANI